MYNTTPHVPPPLYHPLKHPSSPQKTQIGLLDQGYWPDGIYTAPTDDALHFDIRAAKAMGYNMLRKHIKVEPDRWYYWADKLGMLVWQDHPSMFWEQDAFHKDEGQRVAPSRHEAAQWEAEYVRMVEEHYSFPCIIVYVVFNEAWGQYDTVRVTKEKRALDRSRLWTPASGWDDFEAGDIIDMHKYEDVVGVFCTYIYIYIYIHIYTCTHTCIYARTYTSTHSHPHPHTRFHCTTQVCRSRCPTTNPHPCIRVG